MKTRPKSDGRQILLFTRVSQSNNYAIYMRLFSILDVSFSQPFQNIFLTRKDLMWWNENNQLKSCSHRYIGIQLKTAQKTKWNSRFADNRLTKLAKATWISFLLKEAPDRTVFSRASDLLEKNSSYGNPSGGENWAWVRTTKALFHIALPKLSVMALIICFSKLSTLYASKRST